MRPLPRRSPACFIWSSLLLFACNSDTASLVGAKTLPPKAELMRETIDIYQWNQNNDLDFLRYELLPNDEVKIAHLRRALGGDRKISEEMVRLSPHTAIELRHKLWRLRPAELGGLGQAVYPVDCTPPVDSGIQASVAFVKSDASIGVFLLPLDCNASESRETRRIVFDVINSIQKNRAPAPIQS